MPMSFLKGLIGHSSQKQDTWMGPHYKYVPVVHIHFKEVKESIEYNDVENGTKYRISNKFDEVILANTNILHCDCSVRQQADFPHNC